MQTVIVLFEKTKSAITLSTYFRNLHRVTANSEEI